MTGATLRHAATLLAMLALAGGCDWRPRDPSGTEDRVRATGVIRVGMAGADDPAVAAFLPQLAQDAEAVPRVERGAAEPLLQRLDRGELDMVVGTFANDSPWLPLVGAVPPLDGGGDGGDRIAPRALVRAGENGWQMLAEARARKLAAKGARP